MTTTEAEQVMRSVGCMDVRNVGCLHIAYCHYCDRAGRGECDRVPVSEAYALLVAELKKPPTVKQGALFASGPDGLG